MDDRRAALLLAGLALTGAGVRYALAPPRAAAPGDVRLAARDTPPPSRLRETARTAARLARPLLPGERIDLDRADVTEITRLPRVGPALAQRIVAWRDQHGRLAVSRGSTASPGSARTSSRVCVLTCCFAVRYRRCLDCLLQPSLFACSLSLG